MRYNPQVIKEDDYLDLRNGMKRKPSKQEDNLKTIEDRYKSLEGKRSATLERARRFSTYTIPNLYPEVSNGTDSDGVEQTGWQSFGSQCVNNLVNKLIMTLFPPHSSFARLQLTEDAKKVLEEGDNSVIEQSKALVNAEKKAMDEHENIAGRVALGEGIEHLVVGGNTCLYLPPKEGNLINYPLQRYVVRRDKSGNVLELIVEESKSLDTFTPAEQMMIKSSSRYQKDSKDDVKLYTKSVLKNGKYEITQEAMGVLVGTKYTVNRDNFPFIVLRWKSNYGEDYGRSFVEQYSNDLHFIQFLSEALAKGFILMADVKYLVKAGAITDIDHLINSPTGEFLTGNLDDISVLQLDKYADFTPLSVALDKYERRVGSAFLLGRAVQRDAERVTTTEIRRDSLEMSQSLGGVYSLLANTLQRPYFRLLLNRIKFTLPSSVVSTVLMTGIEALSKLSDADKYAQWTEAMIAGAALPPQIQQRVKWKEFSQYHANQLSFDLPFMMTDEEFQAAMEAQKAASQEQAMQEAAVKSAPQIAGNLTRQ